MTHSHPQSHNDHNEQNKQKSHSEHNELTERTNHPAPAKKRTPASQS